MRIVMTGATAGIGLFAATRMADAGYNLVVGARSPDTPPAELAGRASFLPLDLDSLTSVRAFVEALGPQPVDRLVLNAGLQSSRPAVSADGFERTFAVNHLAHFLLLDLLVDRLASGARVVFTGSGTHDPAEKTPSRRRSMPLQSSWPIRIAIHSARKGPGRQDSGPAPRRSCATS